MSEQEIVFPRRRHPDCARDECRTCLQDHDLLDAYLDAKTRDNHKHDLLGKYRSWLDRNKIHADTNGWASRQAWGQENVDAFIEEWKETHDA